MTTQVITGLGTLHLTRGKGYADMTRSYHVLIDGEDVGTIKQGQTISLDVAPGEHEMQLKIDWARSNLLRFDGREPGLEIECGNSMTSLPKLFLAVLYISLWSLSLAATQTGDLSNLQEGDEQW